MVCDLFCNCNAFFLLDIIILNRVILFETRCTLRPRNYVHATK